MIKSFRCKETEKIWNQEYSKKFSEDIQRVALRKLFMIQRAKELKDLKIINSEILRYTKKDFDNFKKILGLLVLFETQNDEFRKAVFKGERKVSIVRK